MAIAVETFSHVHPSRRQNFRVNKERRLGPGAVVLGAGIAACLWAATMFATMQTMTPPSLGADRGAGLQASLGLRPIIRAVPAQRDLRPSKFSRLGVLSADQIPAGNLTASAIQLSRTRMAAIALKVSVAKDAKRAVGLALAEDKLARTRLAQDDIEKAAGGRPSVIVTALAESADTYPGAAAQQRFDLVLKDPGPSLTDLLPDTIPLPVKRPEGLATVALPTREVEKKLPVARELAYAKPVNPMLDDEDKVEKKTFSMPRVGNRTAIYDITAGVVHMPSGEKLEAHSGIGKMRDNPNFVHVKMRGPTPPGTYKVTLREKRFHGVEAVRLTPLDGINPHGRDGLLAHSYLLRNRGDSHGCVAFEEYPRFLKAFKRGEIDTMIIVTSMKGGFSREKKTIASLFSSPRQR